jgi:putative membrane protein
VSEKAKVKETVRLYTKVWQLPSFTQIVLRMALLVLASSAVSTILKGVFPGSSNLFTTYALYLLYTGVPAALGTTLLYIVAAERNSPLDARRTAGAVQFGLLFWYVMGMIGSVVDASLSSQYFEPRFWLLGASLGYLAFAFLVNGLSDHSEIRNFLGALMPYVLWLITAILIAPLDPSLPSLSQYWMISATISIVVISAVVHYIYRAVSIPFERDLGINGPDLLRAFGHEYLTDNPRPIESILTGIATVQDIPMELILFAEGGNPIACGVVSYVHPGPFRDIGSSDLPSELARHIQQKHGIHAFVLHGSCTHQQNLTTKQDYAKVYDEIDRLIETTETHAEVSGPFWTDGGKFKVWTLFIGPDVLTITTSSPEFTDDIALEVGIDTADMIRSRLPGLGAVSIVDAHNCINDYAVSVTRGDSEASEYVGTVSEAVFSTSDGAKSLVEIGIHQAFPDEISAKEGIGPGGITSLVMRTSEGELALITVDGNNMVPGFREQVIGILKAQGFDNAEVVTTDTHVVNAISLSSRGYPPVGKYKPEETIENILFASERARAELRPATVGLGSGKVRDVRTFGEKGFDILTQDVAEAAGIAKRSGIASAVAAFLVSLLFAFLL